MSRRKSRFEYWAKRKAMVCRCNGYWFPHRRGGGACDESSKVDYYRAMRAGVPKEEAMELLSVADLEKLFPLHPEQEQSDDSDIPF